MKEIGPISKSEAYDLYGKFMGKCNVALFRLQNLNNDLLDQNPNLSQLLEANIAHFKGSGSQVAGLFFDFYSDSHQRLTRGRLESLVQGYKNKAVKLKKDFGLV